MYRTMQSQWRFIYIYTQYIHIYLLNMVNMVSCSGKHASIMFRNLQKIREPGETPNNLSISLDHLV